MTVINIEQRNNQRYRKVDVERLLHHIDQKDADRLRMEITRARKLQEPPLVRCGICKEPVYIKANPLEENLYHFSHFKTDDSVLKRCIQRTDNQSNLALIRALKYRGVREGALHFRLKHIIAGLLQKDESINPASVKIESTLLMEGEWRKPDVQAVHNDRLIAFEVQVSTEMAPMIVAREYFYERFGNILWILPTFSPEGMNQSQRDILTTNHDHLFVLDKEMRRLSKEKCRLYLQAWIHWPVLNNGKLERVWMNSVVTLSDITFNGGHALVLDVETEERRIRAAIEQAEKQRLEEDKRQEERQQEVFLIDSFSAEWDEWWERWQAFSEELAASSNQEFLRRRLAQDALGGYRTAALVNLWLTMHGVEISLCNCSRFVLRSLLCASDGVLAYGYSSWKWIAKTLLKEHPSWFSPFYHILKANRHKDIWAGIKNDPQVNEARNHLKRSPLHLNDHQKRLLGLVEPKLQLDVPRYTLEPYYRKQGPIFLYNKQRLPDEEEMIFPKELTMVNHYLRRHQPIRNSNHTNNILEALQLMR